MLLKSTIPLQTIMSVLCEHVTQTFDCGKNDYIEKVRDLQRILEENLCTRKSITSIMETIAKEKNNPNNLHKQTIIK